MKKILALVLVAAMMMTMVAAFAATGDLSYDSTVSVRGLDTGDSVAFYRVIHWVDGEGWALDADYANNTACQAVLASINGTTSGSYALTQSDVAAFTAVINGDPGVSPTKTVTESGGVATYTIPANGEGMFIALVTPKIAGTVYNPIVVSSDFSSTNNTSEILASDATFVGSDNAVAKKKVIEVKKTAPEYTHDSGDEVTFTIETTIPAFAEAYTDPVFTVTDQLSDNLDLVSTAKTGITVTGIDEADWSVEFTGTNKFVITVEPNKLKTWFTAKPITITYTAKLNSSAEYTVNEEDNTVTIEYSNNPDDASKHGFLKDKTNHYTFDIDGALFGNSDWRTAEVVKVGLDAAGNAVEDIIKVSNGSEHSALAGAKFKLEKQDPTTGTWSVYSNEINGVTKSYAEIVTDDMGLFDIKGLDEGTYRLTETDAPDGYIKDPDPHTIVITAEIEEVEETETIEGQEVTYKVPTLKSYEVTIDGVSTNHYDMTLDGPSVSKVTKGDVVSSEIKNIKGVELPSTGGIGTTIFYLVGGLMVLAAGIVLVSRRKAEEE